jgi:hypothetical protein
MDKTRRRFFKDYLIRNTLKTIKEAQESYQRGKTEAEYFESYETAYPLVSEYMSFLDEEAQKLGVETAGKTNLEITKEIYSKRNKK